MKVQRPGRTAAVVGAVVAVSATSMIAFVTGTAAASEPGRCVETVNVRAQPDINSQIVALCEAGTEVLVGEARNGFLRLTNLGGWSAQEFVSVNGAPPAEQGSQTSPSPSSGAQETEGDASATGGTGGSGGGGGFAEGSDGANGEERVTNRAADDGTDGTDANGTTSDGSGNGAGGQPPAESPGLLQLTRPQESTEPQAAEEPAEPQAAEEPAESQPAESQAEEPAAEGGGTTTPLGGLLPLP